MFRNIFEHAPDKMDGINEHGEEVEVISDFESESEVETSLNRNLQPLEGATSVVWKFFGFDADEDGQIIVAEKRKRTTVSCNRCNKKLKYTGGTSNLHYHLDKHHKSEYEQALHVAMEESGKAPCGSRNVKDSKQMTIEDSFAKVIPLPRSSERYKKLTTAVCYFICKDQQPFDTINDSEFRHMLNVFELRYIPPDRKTIASNHIPALYDDLKESITKQMTHDACFFSITTDLWSSRAKQSYIALTIHYLTKSFEMRSHLIETKEFAEAHTGETIAEVLEQILYDWNVDVDKLVVATADNGSNITRAMQLLGWDRISCFSHTLQLCVDKVINLPRVSKAVARCKQLVSHFNHSSKSSYLLKQKQYDLKHKQHHLIQSVATRWNSSFCMMERVIEQQQPLSATLSQIRKGDLMPTDSEISAMYSFVEFMKPFVQMTEAIGGEKWVTISSVRPLIHKITHVFLQLSEGDSAMVKEMKQLMLAKMNEYYGEGCDMEVLDKAMLLDPRFKNVSFVSSDILLPELKQTAREISRLPTSDTNASSTTTDPAVKNGGKLMSLLNDIIHSPDDYIEPVEKANLELQRYLSDVIADQFDSNGHLNPLQWWKQNTARYPCISVLARKYLSIPATSIPSERAFSLTGHLVNEKRAALLPGTVNTLAFLAGNLK